MSAAQSYVWDLRTEGDGVFTGGPHPTVDDALADAARCMGVVGRGCVSLKIHHPQDAEWSRGFVGGVR